MGNQSAGNATIKIWRVSSYKASCSLNVIYENVRWEISDNVLFVFTPDRTKVTAYPLQFVTSFNVVNQQQEVSGGYRP